jgi:hypothetical protein
MMDESPSTVREAVDEDGSFSEQLAEAVREQLAAAKALVTGPMLEAAIGRVVEAAAARLDTPLADLLTAAWARHPDIQALADALRHPAAEETLAELAKHDFGWSYQPEVELVINEATTIPIPVAVKVGVTVLAGVLVVQGGRFRELRAGNLNVGATATVAGQEVAKRSKEVALPGVLRFGEAGVPIIRDAVPAVKIAARGCSRAPERRGG